MNKLSKLILTLACVGGLSYQANALSIGDGNYVGSINDGVPPSPANEVSYINYLITLTAGQGNTQLPPGTGEIYNRVGSSLAGPFPTAVTTDAVKDESGGTTIDAKGYSYILAKYDQERAGSLVWYISGGASGSVTVPDEFNGHEVSHISLYNYSTPPGGNLPDGGTTVAMLGVGLLAASALNHRKKS